MILQYLLFSIISYTTRAGFNYDGLYISGTATSSASSEFLSLSDFARRLIAPSDINYQTPTGVLDYGENAFSEGALWAGNIWTQNTYGYGYSATPFLNLAQTTTIQTSYLWWFDHQGDGGQFYGGLPDVPNGMLCDNGSPIGCNYMQCGPGRSALLTKRVHVPFSPSKTRDTIELAKKINKLGDTSALGHDWIIEGTLAGGIMQAELILSTRNLTAAQIFLPKLQSISNFLETRRVQDASSLTPGAQGLFFAGNGANLLAPGFGGQGLPAGCDYKAYNANCSQTGQPLCCVQSGFSYLSGLTITYSALLDRMIELENFAFPGSKSRNCTKPNHDTSPNYSCLGLWKLRRASNDQSMAGVLINSTNNTRYFLKSLDPDGEKHGVYTYKKKCSIDAATCPPVTRHGYFETSPNVDAIAHGIVDASLASEIYQSMLNVGAGLNPCGFTLPNFPDYDDMVSEDFGYGTWVSGGSWSTLEARVILTHFDQKNYKLAINSIKRLQSPYAELYKMDNPLSHQGCGPGMYSGNKSGNILDIDAFGIPAAFLRGMFRYTYGSNNLILIPRIPIDVNQIIQKFPIKWGKGEIYLTTVRKKTTTTTSSSSSKSSDVDVDKVTLVQINGTTCTSCINQDGHVNLIWDDHTFDAASTSIVITLGSGSGDGSGDGSDNGVLNMESYIYNGTIMAKKWQSSQEDNLIDLSVDVNNKSSCQPNSTIISWSKNMTMFKQSMVNAGFDHRFEYVQAIDFLKALNDSITRCNGRKDGSILPMPAPPDAWKNYNMLYNQTEVEWYFEDVYRRLWKGLESVITSYKRDNALPIEMEIIQIYNGNGGTMTSKDIEMKTKLINLNNEIETMEKKLLKMKKERKVLEL